MKKMLTLLAIVTGTCASLSAHAATIDFNSGLDPFFSYSQVATTGTVESNSGYDNMLAYTNDNGQVAYNPSAISPSTFTAAGAFTLNSLLLAGAWGTQTLTINGLFNGTTLHTKQIGVSTNPISVSFDWSGINAFTIATGSTYVRDETLSGRGQHWVLDNVLVNENAAAVPEPKGIALLALGMLGLMAARRKSAKE